jgi:hypothetical protein
MWGDQPRAFSITRPSPGGILPGAYYPRTEASAPVTMLDIFAIKCDLPCITCRTGIYLLVVVVKTLFFGRSHTWGFLLPPGLTRGTICPIPQNGSAALYCSPIVPSLHVAVRGSYFLLRTCFLLLTPSVSLLMDF